jgi:hypothetical protein
MGGSSMTRVTVKAPDCYTAKQIGAKLLVVDGLTSLYLRGVDSYESVANDLAVLREVVRDNLKLPVRIDPALTALDLRCCEVDNGSFDGFAHLAGLREVARRTDLSEGEDYAIGVVIRLYEDFLGIGVVGSFSAPSHGLTIQ